MPVRLAPGSKSAYHAAAVLAAGGFVALLDAIAELGRVAGLDEAGSLAIYGPLIEQTLGNARALGIRAALTGPMTRGDGGRSKLTCGRCAPMRPASLALYVAAAEREIALAEARGALTPEAAGDLRDSHLQRRSDALPLRPMERQHRGEVRGPSGGPIRPPVGAGAGASTGPPRGRLVPGRVDPTDGHPAARRQRPRPPPRRLARLPRRTARRSPPTAGRGPRSTMHWARSGRAGTDRRSSAATAPWRG